MAGQSTSHFSSQKPQDISWRVNAARVDAAIEGMVRDPILADHMDKMEASGASTDERRKFLSGYFVSNAMSDAK